MVALMAWVSSSWSSSSFLMVGFFLVDDMMGWWMERKLELCFVLRGEVLR